MIIRSGEFINKKVASKDAVIFNKYRDGNVEINIYSVGPGASYILIPPSDPKGIKIYYLVEGAIQHVTSGEILQVNDTVILKSSDDYFYYQPLEESTLYLTAYGDPSFEISKEKFATLNETMLKIQLKDHYTNLHCQRVLELAKAMAIKMGLSGRDTYNFVTAARYHDLGKIIISDDILNKPSRLSDDEYKIMQDHVNQALSLLPAQYDPVILRIISEHHERLDGSGYPQGLTGQAISEPGKALAVLDTFDAMTSNRIYKPGKTIEESFQELYELADLKYSRKYIDLLHEIVHEQPDLIKKLRAL